MLMPKEIVDKLIWLFLLAPGFVAVTIMGMIVDLGELNEFKLTFYSLLLTVAILGIVIFLFKLATWFLRRRGTNWVPSSTAVLSTSIIASMFLGLGMGLAAEGDSLFATLRSLPIADTLNKRSSSRPVTFLLSQNTRGRLAMEGDARAVKVSEAFALITMKNGKRFEGWPEFYGLGKDPSEIYLSPACEVSSKPGKELFVQVPGPGVIIYESEISSIVLIERASSRCFLKWYPQNQPIPKPMPKSVGVEK
jgi:hypothetical protein